MAKIIEAIAEAKQISAGSIKKIGNSTIVDNEGQYCMALVPIWKDWGETLLDGTKLIEGKHYKIIIEIED